MNDIPDKLLRVSMRVQSAEDVETVTSAVEYILELEKTERTFVAQHLDMLANEQVPDSEDEVMLRKAADLLRSFK